MDGSQPHTEPFDSRGPRCYCGHYESEHETKAELNGLLPAGRCSGAYATLMADADDLESVEVRCHCQHFSVSDLAFERR